MIEKIDEENPKDNEIKVESINDIKESIKDSKEDEDTDKEMSDEDSENYKINVLEKDEDRSNEEDDVNEDLAN